MAPDPVVQERVYRALMADLRSGFFPPGAHAGIHGLSRRYGSSETPVREVAWRAVGEGLLEPDPGGGFRSPAISPAGLRDMYRWNMLHSVSALSLVDDAMLIETAVRSDRTPLDTFDPALGPATLFGLIAGATANGEFISAIERMNARLSAIRIAEHHILADNRQEISAMLQMISAGSSQALKKAVRRYHARREAAAAYLVEAVQKLGPTEPRPERRGDSPAAPR